MRHGLLAKNVVTGLRKNKGRRLTRFLSVEELARLYAVMDEHVADCPRTERKQGRDIVRLLILTGCRRSEILRLRWGEIDGDQLRIKDSKTGRCDIQLCAEARDILHRQARDGGLYVFPSTLVRDAPVTKIDSFWYAVRQRARLDVFDAAPMTLQRGDRIRWTRNDNERGLINAHQAEVTDITVESNGQSIRMRTDDGRNLSLGHSDPQLGHCDYARASTAHGAQGRTAGQVIAVMDSDHAALSN